MKADVRKRALDSGMDVSAYVRFVLALAMKENGITIPKEGIID